MFDYDDCEPYEFESSCWHRARKEHKCSACHEVILRGDRYWKFVGKFDNTMDTVNHCARCHLIYEHLCQTSGNDEAPMLTLDCGHDYENPPPEIAALAFVTRQEAQAMSPSKPPQEKGD